MQRRFLTFVIASTVFMAIVLRVDRARRSEVPGRQVLCAILVATTGEFVLSLGWGLYSYRHFLIPLYVPPGHGLFYLLAADSARQEVLRVRERIITRSVLIAGTLLAIGSLLLFGDSWGFLWWLGALLLIRKSANPLLLSTCFVYTILLEWAGTAIGNWHWTAAVPFVGLHSANPPAGVGILYILLDLIVVALTTSAIPFLGEPAVETS